MRKDIYLIGITGLWCFEQFLHCLANKIIEDIYAFAFNPIHILPPIYPDLDLNKNKAIEKMKEENEKMVKEIYEATYQIPLVYNVK